MNLIPPIGTTGLYTVSPPFTTILKSSVSYVCNAVRQLSDFLALGTDPFVTYYEPYNLPESQYEEDLRNNVCIVSLQSTDGSWVYIPSSFILKYPEVNGIPYNLLTLMVVLGALPDSLDLTYIKNKITDDLISVVGVTPQIHTVVASSKTLVSQQVHNAAEESRQLNITKTNTDYSEIIALRNQNTKLLEKVAALETYIKEHS